MFVIDKKMEYKYASDDYILRLLDKYDNGKNSKFVSHTWLKNSLPKRMIYHHIYGDLMSSNSKKILDVGGGYCAISDLLRKFHNYKVLDIMAHDDVEDMDEVLIKQDWYEFDHGVYDIVIANDVFPNVDQRLELFIEKFLGACKELRLVLTYYNKPTFYKTKRIDADEIFCQLAYNGDQVKTILSKYTDENLDALLDDQTSLFSNGRQVSIITLRK
jgi:hypothetical protein